ncbi:MAG: VCBS repeat-containing protein [Bacteroidota bacterium]|nr:VCBS repeat-containing protein [Bacteroidota bacterium]
MCSKANYLHISAGIKNKKYGLINCLLLITFSIVLFSCSEKKKIKNPLFTTIDSSQSGINFINKLTPTPAFNLFSYMYFYNGAGVGAADFNNDGKIDLFFSSNEGDNKLYLNKGGLKFEDVTASAGIPQDGGWSTGVSVVDINNDGLKDIYICKVGHYKSLHSHNQLLICQGIDKNGIPHYKDEAKEYGLDFSGFSTQAVFFDYDGDGDLDMFLLNHSVNHDGNYAPRKYFLNTYDSLAGQKLFRNDSYTDASGKTHIHFTDVTKQSRINGSKIGYGLGVTVADINLDGWPDIYVGNDFHEDDYLYINQHNGTFTEESTKRLMHTSEFSMGVDIADVNNDAYPEIISMDMLPYDPYILRRSLAEDDYDIFTQKIAYGYSYQYSRNNLQLNRRNGLFTEIGQYAGIYATDWSWSALWMDFNNDGLKDLFISNGVPKRMNDIDYINFVSSDVIQQKLIDNKMNEQDMALINKFPEIKIPNKFYANTGNLIFKDVTDSIQNNTPSFSNGAVYADLDNDGDLDIVTNNTNQPALLYENTANDKKQRPFVRIELKGSQKNIDAIGAKIILFANGGIRTYENNAVHGFQSSMLEPIEIGLYHTKIDSAFLIWPDNTFEPIQIKENQKMSFSYKPNLPRFDYSELTSYFKNPTRKIKDITSSTGVKYDHVENPFNEFYREPLLPHMVSTEGPALAVADINHDGLDDIFVGASKTYQNAVFLQTKDGKFVRKKEPDMEQDSMWENVDAKWVDVNNDGNLDLVIASGGNEYYGKDKHLLPLLYLNDGKGNLKRKSDAFSDIYVTQSVVVPCDFNGDGFVDLFIGGRAEPWQYGTIPRSYLLQNDGTGKFTDVTEKYSKELMNPGMVTDAQWVDIDKDGDKDLILCYEWGGIDVFINNKNSFTRKQITDKKGWWNFILPVDINNDGNIDLIAGNLGLNTKLKASDKQPVSMYYDDFDENGKKEQVLTYYVGGQEIPFATKQELEKQMPYLRKKFLYAADFAKASLTDLFGEDKLKEAYKFTANYFANSVLINKGNLKFELKPLPRLMQMSEYRDAVVVNANNDSLPDILMMGNYYDNNVELGRLDGDFGSILVNKGGGNFSYEPFNGLAVKGQVRHIRPIEINGRKAFVLARNNDSLMIVQFQDSLTNRK